MKSTYSYSRYLSTFTEQTKDIRAEGFDLIDVKYANGVWFGSYGKNIGKSDYFVSETTYAYSNDFQTFKEQIWQTWDRSEDFGLTDVEYADGTWFGTFASNIGDTSYYHTPYFSDLVDNIQLKLDDDLDIVDIEYADGTWFAVFGDNIGDSAYSYSSSYDTFTGQIEERREQGLELTNVEYVNGYYHGIFNDELSGLSDYTYSTSLSEFEEDIQAQEDKGFLLINVEEVKGGWFGVYKENIDRTDDIITPSEPYDSPTDTVIHEMIIPNMIYNW